MNTHAYTPMHIQDLINRTAMEANILPLTSRCDSACIFCSHQNNPPQVQVLSVGERSLEDILDTMQYLDPTRTITIGESATNIIEGEPTSHKEFLTILQILRQRFPNTPVSITTNGHHLTRETLAHISRLMPVYINLSINSSSVACHRQLMRDSEEKAKCAIAAVALLDEYHIPFSCSMVGMPNITGTDDIRQTIRDIAHYGADSIQIFMPGFSSHVRENIFPDPDHIYSELKRLVEDIAPQIECPVLLEPSYVQNLRCIISGVRKDSPAWQAGLRKGDEILSVNGQRPYSRVDAYNCLNGSGKRTVTYRPSAAAFKAANPCSDIPPEKTASALEASWTNTPDGSCGIAMEYDFDPDRARYMEKALAEAPGKVLLLCSEFAYPLMKTVLSQMSLPENCYALTYVPNITFGGTIRAAGLLCYEDYLTAARHYIAQHDHPAALGVPGESFNYLGLDLTGHHYSEIGQAFHLPVALL